MKISNSTFFLILFLVSISLFSQKIPTLVPEIGKVYDFSQEKQELWTTCDSLMFSKSFKENRTPQEFSILMDKCGEISYSEACESMWSIVCGDHWTDEGYNIAGYKENHPNYKFTTASSVLKSQSKNNYSNESTSDLNYKTAWVEGVKGYGVGEYVAFNFRPSHPRITKVIIANGYVKDKKTWKDNTRVKQLKMYLNKKPFAILNLKDVYAEQTFSIATIGGKITQHTYKGSSGYYDTYKDNTGRVVKVLDKKNELLGDRIRFEILSVYKGDKYKDTAITEIYFDGLDVY